MTAQKSRSNEDVKSAVDRFILTLSQLQSVLAKETDFLKVANQEAFLRMQEEKVAVAQAYQRDVSAVRNVAKTLKEKYPNLVPFLQDKQASLKSVLNENEQALKRMEKSTRRLSARIMDAARQAAIEKNSLVYGSAGQLDNNKRASIGVSESA
ncbi:MAG: hypothetical protein H6863_01500 [Rhodospirillales bacterium]|nr:hypothetical protein [Rhodospirillales bacterium]